MNTLCMDQPNECVRALYIENGFTTQQWVNNFQRVTTDDLKAIITKAPPKSCELDPIPTTLIKQHSNMVTSVITDIVNCLLSIGTLSENLKAAILWPLLKKANLQLIFKSYLQSLTFHICPKSLKDVSAINWLKLLISLATWRNYNLHTEATIQQKQPYSKLKQTF